MKFMLPAILLIVLLSGCAPNLARQEIGDLRLLPQQPGAYLDGVTDHDPLIPGAQQQQRAAAFIAQHFAPWSADAPLATTEDPFWAIAWISQDRAFGENLRPLDPARRDALIALSDPAAYPSMNRRAISIRRTNLRALPTDNPLFSEPRRAGSGFPFDLLQHGALAANTPLRISHQSRDGAWLFAETPLLYGWLPAADLAWVDDAVVAALQGERYLVLTHDRVAVPDTQGHYRFHAGIGTLLPLQHQGAGFYHVLIAVADRQRRAQLVTGLIDDGQADIFPLVLTRHNLATLGGRMIGQPYGWGDLYGGRDCSGLVRDIFAPFGLWLPRHSSRQAEAGRVIPLADLPSSRREARLLAEGVPFLTLVHLPGHIMLYLGEYAGRAVLLHSIWGLRTRDWRGQEGRWIIGRTLISTLTPGHEQAGRGLRIHPLRDRVDHMTVLDLAPAATAP